MSSFEVSRLGGLVLGKSEAGYKAGWGGGKRGSELEENREFKQPRISEYL